MTKSLVWLGAHAQDTATPLQYKITEYLPQYKYVTFPGAAPSSSADARELWEYDDPEEAPWALRFGVDPNVPAEPVAPRMAACLKLSFEQLGASLAVINTKLPAQDAVSIALINGCVTAAALR